jgi:hypothetical protein
MRKLCNSPTAADSLSVLYEMRNEQLKYNRYITSQLLPAKEHYIPRGIELIPTSDFGASFDFFPPLSTS